MANSFRNPDEVIFHSNLNNETWIEVDGRRYDHWSWDERRGFLYGDWASNRLVRAAIRYGDFDAADLPSEEDPEEKATQLLREHLTEGQWDFLTTRGYLQICSSLFPRRTYRIPRYYRETMDMVELWESGHLKELLCVQPQTTIPDADRVLMHKLLIETDEAGYLNVAKRWHPVTHRELTPIPTTFQDDATISRFNASVVRHWRRRIPIHQRASYHIPTFGNSPWEEQISSSVAEMDFVEVEFFVYSRDVFNEASNADIMLNGHVVGQHQGDFPDGFSKLVTISFLLALNEDWLREAIDQAGRVFEQEVVRVVRNCLER